ncbi:DUF7344 domain-containing protein [Halorientalis pallida]|uniref:DUF7344 domain-containing protein n=1 Tax=Halorientalis pallida TaxID=2479928 RepID=A0A498L5J7_9EURY|nr:hypothetical protein [Halorientalis pallida]RXK51542.1 hypothetical protein EAF64_02610 [Halorientalis pallida]
MEPQEQNTIADDHTQSLGERTADEVAGLATSDRHRALADERRRTLLSILEAPPVPRRLDDLAAAVATAEADGDVPAPEAAESVRIALHHCHLPMLSELGLLDYDPDARRIE